MRKALLMLAMVMAGATASAARGDDVGECAKARLEAGVDLSDAEKRQEFMRECLEEAARERLERREAAGEESDYPDQWKTWERLDERFPEWAERMDTKYEKREELMEVDVGCDLSGDFNYLAVTAFGMTEEFMKMSEFWMDNQLNGYDLPVAPVETMHKRFLNYIESMQWKIERMTERYGGLMMSGALMGPCAK